MKGAALGGESGIVLYDFAAPSEEVAAETAAAARAAAIEAHDFVLRQRDSWLAAGREVVVARLADEWRRVGRSGEARVRIVDDPAAAGGDVDHVAYWPTERVVRVALAARARRVAALAYDRVERETRAALAVTDEDGHRLFKDVAAWRAAAPALRAAILLAALELEETERRLFPFDEARP